MTVVLRDHNLIMSESNNDNNCQNFTMVVMIALIVIQIMRRSLNHPSLNETNNRNVI